MMLSTTKRFLAGLLLCHALVAFADETEIEAVRAQINDLAGAGRNQETLPYIGQLLNLRRAYRGEEHAEVARAMLSYAMTYDALRQPEQAEAWFARTLAMLERVAPDSEPLAFGLTKYGWFLKDQKQYERAEPLLARALAVREHVLGESDPETAWSVRNLAWLARARGDFPRAIALFERCDRLREKVRGPRHPETLDNLRDLADTCLLAGDGPRGLGLLREAATRQEQATGAESPEVAARLTRLGEALRDTKALAEAEAVFRRLLALRQKLGADVETANAWEWLSGVQERAKNFDGAIASRLEMIALLKKDARANARRLLHPLLAVGELHAMAGEAGPAAACFESFVKQLLETFGPAAEQTRANLRTAARFFLDAKTYPIAADGYSRLLALCETALGEKQDETLVAMHDLAWAWHLAGRYEEEERLLQRLIGLRRDKDGDLHEATFFERRTLAIFYFNRGRNAELLTLARELLRVGEQLHGLESEAGFNDRSLLANALRRVGHHAACAEVQQAMLAYRRQHATNDAALLTVLEDTAAVLETAKAHRDAVPLREEALQRITKSEPANIERQLAAADCLGDDLEELKSWDRSELLRGDALALAEAEFGVESQQARKERSHLGWLYKRWGRYPKAEALLGQVARETEEALGEMHPDSAWAWRNLGLCQQKRGDLLGARVTMQKALGIHRQCVVPADGNTCTIMADLADVLEDLKLYVDAEPLRREVLEVRGRLRGPEDRETLSAKRALGWLFRRSDRFAEAEQLYRADVDATTRALGPEHPDAITACDRLADVYKEWRRFAQAAKAYEHVLELRTKVLGPTHEKTLDTMDDLARMLEELREFAKGESLLRTALERSRESRGDASAAAADAMSSVARNLRKQQRWSEAESLYQAALAIREKLFGSGSAGVAGTLASLAWCAKEQLAFPRAEQLFQRTLEIRTKALGPDHPDTIDTLDDLASLYGAMADYPRAITAYRQEIELLTKLYGDAHAKTVECLNELGGACYGTGRLPEALAAFTRSLAMSEKVFGPGHTTTAVCANWLGITYTQLSDFAAAEPYFQRALRISRGVFGAESEKAAAVLTTLAMLYIQMRDYDRAEARALEAVAIFQKLQGPEGENVAIPLIISSIPRAARGVTAETVETLERATRILEKSFGDSHPYAAVGLRMLGFSYFQQGRHAEAEAKLRRSMALTDAGLGPDNSDSATDRLFLAVAVTQRGDVAGGLELAAEADRIIQRMLGPGSSQAAHSTRLLALLQLRAGHAEEARDAARRSAEAGERVLANLFSFGNEEQRLVFQASANPFELLASTGDIARLAEVVLRQKGIVLDSVLEDRRMARTAQAAGAQALVSSLRADQARLFQLTMERPAGADEAALQQRAGERRTLLARVEQQESELARRQTAVFGRARRALQVKAAEVQAVLPPDTALIEYVRCDLWQEGSSQASYGAVVFTREGQPAWVELGGSAEIEKAVHLFQKSARGSTDGTTLKRALRTLHDAVWAPVAARLPAGIRSLVISPDGELSFVSFATLLDEQERFLAERYAVRYVASGRDLLREVPPARAQTMAIYADPAFEHQAPAAPETAHLVASVTRAFDGQHLAPLPGTAREAAALAALAREHGWRVETALGDVATEARLAAAPAPRILHLATHGFFLAELPHPSSSLQGIFTALAPGAAAGRAAENPMHRSGLALTGAQTTLEAWRRGEAPTPGDDGILTAAEVGGLSLDGAWLVTLSACETGVGEARTGEGVLGLRRGFLQAGAQNLLLTLWPIGDETTVELILDFYRRAFASGDAAQSLAATQRTWLVRLRAERGLSAAVHDAGPFVLSSQGPPSAASPKTPGLP